MAVKCVAYFVNTYPTISHTFIRREIEALEELGWVVNRFAIRRPATLADPRDVSEVSRTSYLIPFNIAELLLTSLTLLRSPIRALMGAWVMMQMALASERRFLRAMFCFPEALILLRRLQRSGARHVHGHFGTNTAAVLRIVRALGGPTYSFTNHGPEEFDNIHSLSLPGKLRDAAFVATISCFARSQLYRWLPVNMWNKVHVVRCGLNFDGQELPQSVPDDPQLLCVGRLSREKGHLPLLRAVKRLADEGVQVRVVLAGNGPLREELESEVRRLGLKSAVTFKGWVDGATVIDLLKSSRALVLPSFAEGLPVVLMESFRAGRPVLATYVGAVAELVEHGASGWLIPASDEDQLVEYMRRIVAMSPEVLTRMGQTGYAAVRRLHDVSCEARKLARLFEEATGLTVPTAALDKMM